MKSYRPLSGSVQIIKNHLYWISSIEAPESHKDRLILNIDKQLIYEPFISYFSPMDISKITRFVVYLDDVLKRQTKVVYLHTSTDEHKRTNAAMLLAVFRLIIFKTTPEDAWRPFSELNPPLGPFGKSYIE